jgi:hypothetical protein
MPVRQMPVPLMRAALIIGACTGVMACSQQVSQSGSSDVPLQVAQRARLCIAEGQPGPARLTDPDHSTWAITVSSEGGPCSHARDWGGPARDYEVLQPPRHGRITQGSQSGKTVVSYWPDRGYVGSDSFALRYPAVGVALPYLVGVIP